MPRTRGKTRTSGAARSAAERARALPAHSAVPAPPAVAWTWVLAVAVAACAVYLNSLGGALLYDDVNAIRNNPFVLSGDVVGILTEPSWWGITRGELWRPLTTLTFALNHALHGLDPFGYHAVNVVLHAAVSVLVLLVFAAATLAPRAAFAAALLFATHPIHTEAVASVVGRAELLAAGGFFLAWWCYIAADAAALTPVAHRRVPAALWLAGAVAAYFLAMCGKETAVVLPAVLVCADLLMNRSESPSVLLRRRFPRYAMLAATAVLFVVLRACVLGRVSFAPTELDNPLTVMPFAARFMTAIKVVALYALRLVFPLWLSADYSFDQVTAVRSPLDAAFLAGLVVFAAVALAAWWGWRRLPLLALGAAVLAFPFAVVGNLFFLIGTLMGERLAYLPSAGFCLMGAAGLAWLGGDRAATASRMPGRWSAAFVVPLVAVVALYGARTVARNPVWREPLGFYSAMVADAPGSARSHRELATALADLGRVDDALREFDRSLAIKPEDPTTLYNYGNALSGAGRFAEAADLYRRSVAINPLFEPAWENLGNAESMRGDNQAALAAMRHALEMDPRSAMLRMNLANTLFRAGSVAEAKTAYEQAIALAPTSVEILTNYGSFLYAQGDYATAISALERIPSPQPVRALVGLVMCYHAVGRATDARAAQATAERLYPQHAAVRQTAEMLRNASGAAP